MNFLNQDQSLLLQNAFSKLKMSEDRWGLPAIIGYIVGRRMSLLGVTQNKDSLYAPKLQASKLLSDLNEVYIFNVKSATQTANMVIDQRHRFFFDNSNSYGLGDQEEFRYAKESLVQENPAEVVNEFVAQLETVIGSTPIITIIHNRPGQQVQAQPTPPQQAAPKPAQPAPAPETEPTPSGETPTDGE